jgi:hypothetical protein
MASKLRALCLASAMAFAVACGGEPPTIAPTAPTAIPLPTHQAAFGSTASNIPPATATFTLTRTSPSAPPR